MLKKFLFLCCVILNVSFAKTVVCMTQITSHPSLDQIAKGIKDTLKSYDPEIEIIEQNAQGNISIANQIIDQFLNKKPNLIITITTPSTLAAVNKVKDIPIIFSAVSDPTAAVLADEQGKIHYPNLMGVADVPPVEQQLDYILKKYPDTKTIGILHNPAEINSISSIEKFKHYATLKNIAVRDLVVYKSTEGRTAVEASANDVDVFFIPNDNTVISGVKSVIKACKEIKKPLFTSDLDSFEQGATGCITFDQYQIGVQTGNLAIEYFKTNKIKNEVTIATGTIIR